MSRLWGEVVESRQLGPGTAKGPMPTQLFEIKVKARGPAIGGMVIMGKVDGRELTVQRETPFPYEFDKGKRIVLDAQESQPLVAPLQPETLIVESPNSTVEIPVRVAALDEKVPEVAIEAKGVLAEWKRKPEKSDGGIWAEGVLAISPEPEIDRGIHTVKLTIEGEGKGEESPSAKLMVTRPMGATCRRICTDLDGDGIEEVAIENPWVRAIGSGQYGARLVAFEDRATGISPICGRGQCGASSRYTRGGLGHGHAPMMWWSGGGPASGSVPAAERTPEVGPDVAMAFRGGVPGAENATLGFRVSLVPDGPIAIAQTTYHYAGKKKDDKERASSDKDEFSVGYRVSIPVDFGRGEKLAAESPIDGIAFHIPSEKMQRRRYDRTPNMWEWIGYSDHYGLTSGYVAAEDEASGMALVVLCDPERVIEVTVLDYWTRPVFSPQFRSVRLGKDEQITNCFGLAVGNAIRATRNGFALLSLGVPIDGRVPVHLLARGPNDRSYDVTAKVAGSDVRMHRQYTPGIGEYWTGVTSAKSTGSINAVACIAGEEYSLSSRTQDPE